MFDEVMLAAIINTTQSNLAFTASAPQDMRERYAPPAPEVQLVCKQNNDGTWTCQLTPKEN